MKSLTRTPKLLAILGAGLLALMVIIFLIGRSAGISSQQPKIERLIEDRTVLAANVATLSEGLDFQNEKIAEHAAAAAEAQERARQALKEAAAMPRIHERLLVAQPANDGIDCSITPLNAEAWKGLK